MDDYMVNREKFAQSANQQRRKMLRAAKKDERGEQGKCMIEKVEQKKNG